MNLNRHTLIGLTLFVGINAVGGGIGLILTNGLGMPIDTLDGTPFGSFLIPGLVLAIVVGGGNLIAFWALLTRHVHAAEIAFVAGSLHAGWIAVQFAMVGYVSVLQPVMGALGLLTMLVAWRFWQERTSRLAG